MSRWRIALHALDRTGPPMLALAFATWLREHHPRVELEFVAFRGGALLSDFSALGTTVTLLDPSEAWDHTEIDTGRAAVACRRAASLRPADRMLLVSVAAGQVLAYLPDRDPIPIGAWVVEQGEDLHWIDGPLDLRSRVGYWCAGSAGIAAELADRHGVLAAELVPEFISAPAGVAAAVIDEVRRSVGVAPDEMLILGAGIATRRKAPDLFVQTALAYERAGGGIAKFVWVGGESDPLFPLVGDEIARLGLENVLLRSSVADFDAWCAAADVLLHPARLDAFPLVALHAAAAGTPVVGFSGAGGLLEMLGDCFEGVPFPDVAGLAGRLVGLNDPARRAAIGVGQRDRVRRAFVADVAAPRLADFVTTWSTAPGASVPS